MTPGAGAARMTPRQHFDAYAAERRGFAPAGFRVEGLPGLARCVALNPRAEGFVHFVDLPGDRADAAINEQIEFFAALKQRFEWKWYAFDAPADLPQRLRRRGFEADAPEAFLVLETACHAARRCEAAALPAGVELLEVGVDIESGAGLRALVALQEGEWGALPWLYDHLAGQLADARSGLRLFLARSDTAIVGSGLLTRPAGSSIADLRGGAVVARWRGRGVYSALLGVRVGAARAAGVKTLAVDAAPMSRPILEAKGFRFVCDTVPFRLPGADPAPPAAQLQRDLHPAAALASSGQRFCSQCGGEAAAAARFCSNGAAALAG